MLNLAVHRQPQHYKHAPPVYNETDQYLPYLGNGARNEVNI